MKEKLIKARELLNAEGPEASRAIRAGAEIVRILAEREDVLEAWELMLAGHEKGLAPFKTKKFGRAAKAAIRRLKDAAAFFDEGDSLLEIERNSPLPDFGWLEKAKKRDAVFADYRQLRSCMSGYTGTKVYKMISLEDMLEAADRLGIALNGRHGRPCAIPVTWETGNW